MVTCGTGSLGVTPLQGSPAGAMCRRGVMLRGGVDDHLISSSYLISPSHLILLSHLLSGMVWGGWWLVLVGKAWAMSFAFPPPRGPMERFGHRCQG